MNKVSKEVFVHPIFIGREVTKQVLLPESTEYVVNMINFGKGVRNKFHPHEYEQILIVTDEKGVVATEKEEKVVTVGDIVLTPAWEKHWRGSGGDSEFSHYFIPIQPRQNTVILCIHSNHNTKARMSLCRYINCKLRTLSLKSVFGNGGTQLFSQTSEVEFKLCQDYYG